MIPRRKRKQFTPTNKPVRPQTTTTTTTGFIGYISHRTQGSVPSEGRKLGGVGALVALERRPGGAGYHPPRQKRSHANAHEVVQQARGGRTSMGAVEKGEGRVGGGRRSLLSRRTFLRVYVVPVCVRVCSARACLCIFLGLFVCSHALLLCVCLRVVCFCYAGYVIAPAPARAGL